MHYALCIVHLAKPLTIPDLWTTSTTVHRFLYTCIYTHLLTQSLSKIYQSINIYKSCSSVQLYTSCTQITPFCEQPEQLNMNSIYICVYTYSLLIPSLRFFELINNKKLFRLFSCSLPGAQEAAATPFPWQLWRQVRIFYIYAYITHMPSHSLSENFEFNK